MIYLTTKPNQNFFFLPYTKQRNFFLRKKGFLRKRVSGGLNKNQKEGFLTALTMVIKKDLTTSIKKHANKLKVDDKTVWTAIKQDLSLDPLDYAVWVFFRNAISHPNIGSLKTGIKEEWNKTSEEFILKAFKSFRRPVDTIIEKNGDFIE